MGRSGKLESMRSACICSLVLLIVFYSMEKGETVLKGRTINFVLL